MGVFYFTAAAIHPLYLTKTNVSSDAALHVPYLEDFQITSSTTATLNKRWGFLFYLLAWCALVVATARPQWIGEPIELPVMR